MQLPKRIYFVGAGGIGMAALVRYALSRGIDVAGYDRTSTQLTDALRAEGARIVFADDPSLIPPEFLEPEGTMLVYTPAVPADNRIFTRLRQAGLTPLKRAALLGRLTRPSHAICVAGSHGKTTTSSMIAHILHCSPAGCNAFLGGVLRNYGSNFLLSPTSEFSVVEADEYDRSFHQLTPWLAVVTSVDPDHLDIYGDAAGYLEGFAHFTELIRPDGYLLLHEGLPLRPRVRPGVHTYTYSASAPADFRAVDISYRPGAITFAIEGPDGWRLEGLSPGVPVEINIDNATAAAAAAHLSGVDDATIRTALASFKGPKRRFEMHLDGSEPEAHGRVLIDDYAHSPQEVRASINSVRKLFPGRRISVVFQPHLYSRTRDFAAEFADALSLADEVILTEIYPAREAPIPGVSSQIIFDRIKAPAKSLIERKDLLNRIKTTNFDILMTLGAADIDVLLPDIKRILTSED